MDKMTIMPAMRKIICGVLFFIAAGVGFMGIPAMASDGDTAPEASALKTMQSDPINGTWVLSLPMPGGTKESTLVLSTHGKELTGSMSAPGSPSEISAVHDGSCADGRFKLSADIGRITYSLGGVCSGGKLIFDMTTTETIPLGNGSRLAGKTGEITGTYNVPVYSPGGIKENSFELAAGNGKITGEMYAPGLEKRDLNTFYDGSYTGNTISLYTKTAQGSLFHFTGTVEGDTIKLTLHVTDAKAGIEAKKTK